jgi:molybdate transport system ATP-binding protein
VTIDVEIRHRFERVALDVHLAAGEGLTALLGPSGAGKTSTLDVIAGLLRPEYARIVVDGRTIADTSRDVWTPAHERRIGYVFQDSRLFPHFSVRQNLTFGQWFTRRGETERGGVRVSFDELVSLLDLAPLLARHPAKLSGGEQKRVALGRALLSRPRLLLLDEPLGSLEAAKRQEILPYLDRLISDLRLPMIYVTHDWDEIRGRATSVVHMADGKTLGAQ